MRTIRNQVKRDRALSPKDVGKRTGGDDARVALG
jgi:hypothetical protein